MPTVARDLKEPFAAVADLKAGLKGFNSERSALLITFCFSAFAVFGRGCFGWQPSRWTTLSQRRLRAGWCWNKPQGPTGMGLEGCGRCSQWGSVKGVCRWAGELVSRASAYPALHAATELCHSTRFLFVLITVNS